MHQHLPRLYCAIISGYIYTIYIRTGDATRIPDPHRLAVVLVVVGGVVVVAVVDDGDDGDAGDGGDDDDEEDEEDDVLC